MSVYKATFFFINFCLFFRWSHSRIHNTNSGIHSTCEKVILYLPLDERFTTRLAFLNLAKVTPYCILSPPVELLPSLKIPGNIEGLHQWVDDNIVNANSMIVSAELFLYGGLIGSRISNETTSVILKRASKLLSYSNLYPDLEVYVSNVVMRIPSYNGDFEEPWYWADYGYDLYTFSFYSDKYQQSKDTADELQALQAKKLVPENAVEEFLWRRERNHNITMFFLDAIEHDKRTKQSLSTFNYFYTTLDDSAEYGFNIREAEEIKAYIADNKLQQNCPVYPGADEVHLVMLSRLAVEQELGKEVNGTDTVNSIKNTIVILPVYRDVLSIENIPSYEGQPMVDTLKQQVEAAGGTLLPPDEPDNINDCADEYDALLLVNNFDGQKQLEASQQPKTYDTVEYQKRFLNVLYYAQDEKIVTGFCDNRYANGADFGFVDFMQNYTAVLSFTSTCYAGWNTNGNTIGTVVANTILLHLFRGRGSVYSKSAAHYTNTNAVFNTLRILEDRHYQADFRQTLIDYTNEVDSSYGECSSNLTKSLGFYEEYSQKVLAYRYKQLIVDYSLPSTWIINTTYYPWNRTFEIGFCLPSNINTNCYYQ